MKKQERDEQEKPQGQTAPAEEEAPGRGVVPDPEDEGEQGRPEGEG